MKRGISCNCTMLPGKSPVVTNQAALGWHLDLALGWESLPTAGGSSPFPRLTVSQQAHGAQLSLQVAGWPRPYWTGRDTVTAAAPAGLKEARLAYV